MGAKKKKWSKGKSRDKLNNLVLFDKNTYDKLYKEVPTYKLITPSIVSERLKVRGSSTPGSPRTTAQKTSPRVVSLLRRSLGEARRERKLSRRRPRLNKLIKL